MAVCEVGGCNFLDDVKYIFAREILEHKVDKIIIVTDHDEENECKNRCKDIFDGISRIDGVKTVEDQNNEKHRSFVVKNQFEVATIDILFVDIPLNSMGNLETLVLDCICKPTRDDSDSVDNLIVKEEKVKPQMADEDKKNMETMFKAILPKDNEYIIEADNLGEDAAPILITRNEFMRRYREMSALGGGMNFYGEMPESFNITANLQNPLMIKLIGDLKNNSDKVEEFAAGSDLLKQLTDLALLSNGLLKGKALSDFIARTGKTLTDYYSK